MDAARAAFGYEFVRLDYLRRIVAVAQAHDVIEPGLLPHRVDVDLTAVEARDDVAGAQVV